MLSESIEDYLKVIYKFENNAPVATNDLSRSLKVAPSSVTKMIKRLAELGFVKYESHKGVKLTQKGVLQSLIVLRRHRIIETFLHDILHYSWDEVHDEANKLEHYISKRFEDSIYELCGKPEYDPHGDPIPDKNGKLPLDNSISILEAEINVEYIISRITPDETVILQYLGSLKLIPGVIIKVVDRLPFGGPIVISYNGESINLGLEAANYIRVSEL